MEEVALTLLGKPQKGFRHPILFDPDFVKNIAVAEGEIHEHPAFYCIQIEGDGVGISISFESDGFARFVTRLLSKRRKQIGGVLGQDIVTSLGIDATMRAETLGASKLIDIRDQLPSGHPLLQEQT